jgi:hypothetical protein
MQSANTSREQSSMLIVRVPVVLAFAAFEPATGRRCPKLLSDSSTHFAPPRTRARGSQPFPLRLSPNLQQRSSRNRSISKAMEARMVNKTAAVMVLLLAGSAAAAHAQDPDRPRRMEPVRAEVAVRGKWPGGVERVMRLRDELKLSDAQSASSKRSGSSRCSGRRS